MKKLNSLSDKEILHYIMESDRLRERFDQYVHDTEMDYVGEKLAVFDFGCADWSIGVCSPNYLSVKDPYGFLYACEKSSRYFGASDREMRKIEQCKKLRDTNLFTSCVQELCEIHYEDEIQPIVKYIEQCGYDIYCKDETDRLLEYIDCFADCYLGDIYVNNLGRLVRIDYIK